MVPQEVSKESVANVSQQGALSDLYACPIHHPGRCYCSQRGGISQYDLLSKNFSSNFELLGTQIDRSIEPFRMSRCKQNGFCDFDYVHGHGLSLSLGNDLELNDVRLYDNKQTNTPTVVGGVICEPSCSCAEHMREGCLTCKDDVSSNSYASRCSYLKLHDVSPLINILQNSPYLEPARQLLDEVVCVSNYFKLSLSGKSDGFNHSKENSQTVNLPMEKQLADIRSTKLTAIREELEDLCRRYFLRMDELVTAFETIAGAGAAAAYTALTIQAMSKHFSNLRRAIIAKIDSSKEYPLVVCSKNDKPKRVALQRLGTNQVKQIWRPLRGLPEESVLVLRGWLFEHFLHPYPSDNEKLLLASRTGLTRNQISNWFINARVRLWKPMIEEMYREELAEEQQNSKLS